LPQEIINYFPAYCLSSPVILFFNILLRQRFSITAATCGLMDFGCRRESLLSKVYTERHEKGLESLLESIFHLYKTGVDAIFGALQIVKKPPQNIEKTPGISTKIALKIVKLRIFTKFLLKSVAYIKKI